MPTGDFLRQIIGSTNISDATLKKLLRKRGIFTGECSRKDLAPYLIRTGLSPNEYNTLIEMYKTKENQLKSVVRSIRWNSNEDLIEAIPEGFDFDSLLEDSLGVCELVSNPQFSAVNTDPNHVEVSFEIRRKDITKNLGDNVSFHKGILEIKKDSGQVAQINMTITHTSKETLAFANSLSTSLVNHFKQNGHIDSKEEIIKIKFHDFDNKSRVLFLKDLTQKVLYTSLTFRDTKNARICIDENKSNPPDKILWMRDKIDDMSLTGKDLHKIFYLDDDSFFEYLLLFGLTCSYDYQSQDFNANCKIDFSFSKRKDLLDGSELNLDIVVTDIKTNSTSKVSKDKASKIILDSLEKYKLEMYHQYKKAV